MAKKNIVGENIRKFRQESGITQEELALRSGLSQGYINQLELGRRNYTQKSLELIADSLSQPVIEFFTDVLEGPKRSKVSEKPKEYQSPKSYKKELLAVLNSLPDPVIEHYLTLMKMEREMLRGKTDH